MRLEAAYASTNRNPLGACAITGTGFPIDRTRTTELLGFDAPTGNTYGSIATVDYLLESVSATAVLLTGLGRVVQDLLLWCTSEFGYLRLADGFVQCSSIMPQKRNPVALEHARAIASKAVGQAGAILTAVHNTPFGDIVDTEDDLQPLVFVDVQGRGPGGAAGRGGDVDGAVRSGAARRARGQGLDHRDRAGRHAGARPRRAVQQEPRDRDAACRGLGAAAGASAARDPRRRVDGASGRPIEYSAEALAEVLSARHSWRCARLPAARRRPRQRGRRPSPRSVSWPTRRGSRKPPRSFAPPTIG